MSNKISKIENVSHLRELQLLELGDNRIRTIENLEGLENLKELYIGKNKIAKIDKLACCPKLRKVILSRHPFSKACLQHSQTVIKPCMWFMEEASQVPGRGPNSTESNLFHHGETTYRVG